jgi:hypothetical protein
VLYVSEYVRFNHASFALWHSECTDLLQIAIPIEMLTFIFTFGCYFYDVCSVSNMVLVSVPYRKSMFALSCTFQL